MATTDIKVEFLPEDLGYDFSLETFQQPDKCGEVFVTKRGIFTYFCIVCKQNFEEINNFTEHFLTFHLDFTPPQNKLLKYKETNDVHETNCISKTTKLSNNSLENRTDDKNEDKDSISTDEMEKNSNLALCKNLYDPLDIEYDDDVNTETQLCGDLDVEAKIAQDPHENNTNSDEEAFDFQIDEKFPFKCDICNKLYKLKKAFVDHKKLHENEMPSCTHCGKSFVDKRSFKSHNQIRCAQRKKSGKTKNTSSKGLPDFKCKYCPRTFKRHSSIQPHEYRHLNPFKCKLCPKKYMEKRLLDDHLRTHTGEKPFKCEYCSLAFVNERNFKRHTLIHTGVRNYICTFGCGKAFHRNAERIGHERTHTGEKPYGCELCGRYFTFRCKLSLHKKRLHTDKKNWSHKCDQCGKIFLTPSQLRDHSVVHTGEKPFACDQCSGRFSKAGGLREHRKLHSGVKKHVCTICNKAFAQTAGLYGHMKSHGVIKENTEID